MLVIADKYYSKWDESFDRSEASTQKPYRVQDVQASEAASQAVPAPTVTAKDENLTLAKL